VKWSELALDGAYSFDEGRLSAAERGIWRSFPSELRRVLRKTNGAIVEGKPSFATKIVRTMPDGRPVRRQTNWLTELWAFIPRTQRPRSTGPRSILHEHFGRHVEEEFLPDGVFVIGMCEQSCLVAVSTNTHDRGAIYYWEWYWQYPWYKPFFDKRIDRVRKRWPGAKAIDRDHPDYARMRDELNYATLVKIAPSFKAWTDSMK
jgi:hypothetical protein